MNKTFKRILLDFLTSTMLSSCGLLSYFDSTSSSTNIEDIYPDLPLTPGDKDSWEYLKNEDGTVTSLISREEYYARHSEQYVEETFGGSLPAFLAAFGTRKKLSEQEIDELQKVIDRMRG